MGQLLQQLLNGLTIGSFYALIALGYTMVYGVLKLINFAHGDLFMLGAYIGLVTLASLVVNVGLAVNLGVLLAIFLIVMSLVGVVGVILERIAYRPLYKAGRLPPIVSALGASIFLQNGVMLLYGARYRTFPEAFKQAMPEVMWELGGARFTLMQVIMLAISFLLMAALYLFVNYTRVGTAMRAVALDHDTARLMGIDVNRIIVLVFIIGPALGAAGGIMVGLFYGRIYFTLGWSYGLKAFTAAILGGIGNIPGAMIGGLLLGLVEALATGFVSDAWKNAIAFFILVIILILRPTGLLGERVAEKL
ncbi:MAG: branched-chain amino acid ABC transporter permease [Anaerolineae bacterium]|nr:branched-chain amino acid ABC transporter permease [Anaerolineae bacterium]